MRCAPRASSRTVVGVRPDALPSTNTCALDGTERSVSWPTCPAVAAGRFLVAVAAAVVAIVSAVSAFGRPRTSSGRPEPVDERTGLPIGSTGGVFTGILMAGGAGTTGAASDADVATTGPVRSRNPTPYPPAKPSATPTTSARASGQMADRDDSK